MLNDVAEIATAKPTPYLKQVCKHFGHKLPVSFDDHAGEILFADGTCSLEAQQDRLILRAAAPTAEGLDHVRRVVGSHLERFGRRDALFVTWQRPTTR